jgi:hypothetical protein
MGLQFSCEVRIPTRETPFGSRTTAFRSQKLAQHNAAKKAVQWLRENGHFGDDGHLARKNQNTEHPTTIANDDSLGSGTTYGQQVHG